MSCPPSSPVPRSRSSATELIHRRTTALVLEALGLMAAAVTAVGRVARVAVASVVVAHLTRYVAFARLRVASTAGFHPGDPGHPGRDGLVERPHAHRRLGGQAGQATAEYALVLLGAAVVAIALITWATGSGRIGALFDRVFDELQRRL